MKTLNTYSENKATGNYQIWILLIIMFATFTFATYKVLTKKSNEVIFTKQIENKQLNSTFDQNACNCNECNEIRLLTAQ